MTKKKSMDNRMGWWYVRFKIPFSDDQSPSVQVDLLISHQILSSIIDDFKESFMFWRFHRRFANDSTGHEFKLIFYSTKNTAKSVYKNMKSDKLLKKLIKNGIIEKVLYDSLRSISRPNLDDTSDNSWPESIKKSFPHYIMGISATWLNLIDDISKGIEISDDPNVDELLQFYKDVSNNINYLWYEHGRHAFLHHLNAIFGYYPVKYLVQTVNEIRF